LTPNLFKGSIYSMKQQKKRIPNRVRTLTLCLITIGGICSSSLQAQGLRTYVALGDPCYNWKFCEQTPIDQWGTLTHLEMVSQHWRGQFWSHHLLLLRPDHLRHPDIALLFITGGSYGAPSTRDLGFLRFWADHVGAVVAVLNKVPNQPLYGRREDALIAYTFEQFIKHGDPDWPLLFPMVKSAVRAMDTIQAYAQKEWGQKIQRFVLSGASKRGWTTWLTGAVDHRVVAVAPMVIDMLNMKVQLEWAKKVWGRQSEQIKDYTQLELDKMMDHPGVVQLQEWVDPYSYRKTYTIPKLILLGTNDPYWVVDALRNYWDGLPEPKLVSQTPNAGHGLGDGKQAAAAVAAFFEMIADHHPLPQLRWKITRRPQSAQMQVWVQPRPKAFRLWIAHSPEDRDFRDGTWRSQPLSLPPEGKPLTVTVSAPKKGWRAFMVEAEMVSPRGLPYKLSTIVCVVPDTLPKFEPTEAPSRK